MAAKGYPGAFERGSRDRRASQRPKRSTMCIVFHAGTKQDGDRILANGGRVLNVTALGRTSPRRSAAPTRRCEDRLAGRFLPRATSAGAPSARARDDPPPELESSEYPEDSWPTISFPASNPTGSTPRSDAIFARSRGGGPPLVLLHGFPQTHVMWHRLAPTSGGNLSGRVHGSARLWLVDRTASRRRARDLFQARHGARMSSPSWRRSASAVPPGRA